MKKHIALGICVLIFLITGGCSFIMPQSGENGYGGGISSTEEERKDVSENKNITFRVLEEPGMMDSLFFWMEKKFRLAEIG